LIWKSLKTDRISVANCLERFSKRGTPGAAARKAVALQTYGNAEGDHSLKERSKNISGRTNLCSVEIVARSGRKRYSQISKSDCLNWAAEYGLKASPSSFNNTVARSSRFWTSRSTGARYDNPAVHNLTVIHRNFRDD